MFALTKIKKKGSGTIITEEFVQTFTRVPKEKRATKEIFLLIKKNFKSKIINWKSIDENTDHH